LRSILRLSLLLCISILAIILVTHIGFDVRPYDTFVFSQIINTIIIIGFTTLFATVVGVSLAWLFGLYNFPLKRFFEILLILGMVFPSYVLAFFYTEIFSMMNIVGLIVILTLSSIPYVFLIVTMSIRSQSQQLIESAMMLGKNDAWIKLRLILPLLKPAIILSSLLVVGDTLSEFGATYFFGVDTLMTGIYEVWFGIHETAIGLILSAWVFIFVLIIYYFINVMKKSKLGLQPTFANNVGSEELKPQKLSRFSGWLTVFGTSLILSLTVFIPFSILTYWVYLAYDTADWFSVLMVTINSSILSTLVAILILIVATILLYLFKKQSRLILTLTNALYSTPGIVITITTMYLMNLIGVELITFFFIYALVIKYLALGVDTVGVGLQKINRQYYYSTKTLGKDSAWYINHIQIPIAYKSYIIAFILIWIDVIRELVIGLSLRPEWLNLVSIKIFSCMDLEILYMSGPWILGMVLITIIPIFVVNKLIKNREIR